VTHPSHGVSPRKRRPPAGTVTVPTALKNCKASTEAIPIELLSEFPKRPGYLDVRADGQS
jgi:hypothetical protein